MSANGIFAGDDLAMMDDAADEIGMAAVPPFTGPCDCCGVPVKVGEGGLIYDADGRHTCATVPL